jgi:hypothetical protein
LVRYGVPFDVAFSLDDIDRAAWAIIISEQGGRKFNLNTMDFDKDE